MAFEPLKLKTDGEEAIIQNAIIAELERLGWMVEVMHASALLKGIPDLFCAHWNYGHRWVEVKKPVGYKFTRAQLEKFPVFISHRSPIWIATSAVGIQQLLMEPSNYWHFHMNVRAAH